MVRRVSRVKRINRVSLIRGVRGAEKSREEERNYVVGFSCPPRTTSCTTPIATLVARTALVRQRNKRQEAKV
jgi:hypothetical protein